MSIKLQKIENLSLDTPLQKHRNTLKDNRYQPYNHLEVVDYLLSQGTKEFPEEFLLDDNLIQDSEGDFDFESLFSPNPPPNSPSPPELTLSPPPLLPFSPNPPALTSSDSIETIPAEDPFLPHSPVSSLSSFQPPKTPDSLLDSPPNSGIPPHIVAFLAQEPELEFLSTNSPGTQESDSQRASPKFPENPPQIPETVLISIPEPATLPQLTAAEVEAELQLIPSQNQFSPPDPQEATSEQTIPQSLQLSPISPAENPPSIFDVKAVPTTELVHLLKLKKEKSKLFKRRQRKHFRKPNRKYYSPQWIQ